MHLSPFHVAFLHPAVPGHLILFSTKTGALVLLPEEEFSAVTAATPGGEYAAELTAMGLLVEDPETEYEKTLNYMEELNQCNPNLTLAVVLGMECNFRCSYCFEGGRKGKREMDERTADQLIAFIKKRFSPAKRKLILQLYGGEPLLYISRIRYLAERLQPFLDERGAELVLDLVSNGSLLTEKVVDELTPWGLGGVKVTLDGPQATHDAQRPFRSGAGSFGVIVDNLQQVCSKTNIRLGGNYTRANYRHFASVLDLLAARGITPDKVERVSFNIVMQVNDHLAAGTYAGGCATINEPWLREAALHVRSEVLKRGYSIADISPEPCAVEINDAYTVHYDGGLYKCITWVGHRQYRIGDIRQDELDDFHASHHLFHWQREPGCRKCRYLPLCFGGCRYMAYQRDGHMGLVDCRKPFYDAVLETMLVQDLRYTYGIIDRQAYEHHACRTTSAPPARQ